MSPISRSTPASDAGQAAWADQLAALPVTVARGTGESIESWLERVSDANGVATAAVMALIRGMDPTRTRFLTIAPSPAAVQRIAQLTRVSTSAVAGGTLAVVDQLAVDLTGLDHADRHSYRHIAARGWTPAHSTQLCPRCLRDHKMWRIVWRLPLVTACTEHRIWLVASCPGCRRPFRDQRHSLLRPLGAAATCGNPTGHQPARPCDVELTALPAVPADPNVSATQSRVDAALTGSAVPSLANPSAHAPT